MIKKSKKDMNISLNSNNQEVFRQSRGGVIK